jgi:hypothetical protein
MPQLAVAGNDRANREQFTHDRVGHRLGQEKGTDLFLLRKINLSPFPADIVPAGCSSAFSSC